jgi:hypothetical protein
VSVKHEVLGKPMASLKVTRLDDNSATVNHGHDVVEVVHNTDLRNWRLGSVHEIAKGNSGIIHRPFIMNVKVVLQVSCVSKGRLKHVKGSSELLGASHPSDVPLRSIMEVCCAEKLADKVRKAIFLNSDKLPHVHLLQGSIYKLEVSMLVHIVECNIRLLGFTEGSG